MPNEPWFDVTIRVHGPRGRRGNKRRLPRFRLAVFRPVFRNMISSHTLCLPDYPLYDSCRYFADETKNSSRTVVCAGLTRSAPDCA